MELEIAKYELNQREKQQNFKRRLQKKKDDENFNRLLTKLFAVQSLPINVVRSPEFISLIRYFQPLYRVPSRATLTSKHIAAMAREIRAMNDKSIEEQEDHSITIEFDGWTSPAGSSIIGIVASFYDGSCSLIDLIDVSSSHEGLKTANYITGKVIHSLRSRFIDPKKINGFVTDDEARYRRARQMLVEEFCHDEGLQLKCQAHMVNLIMSTISKVLDKRSDTFSELTQFIGIITRCRPLMAKIREEGVKRPTRIMPTRWYSASSAILRAIEVRPILLTLMDRSEFKVEKWKYYVVNATFWSDLADLSVYFRKLSSMIGVIESKKATLSGVFDSLLDFGHFLFERPCPQEFKDIVTASFLHYFIRNDYSLLIAAYILDPRFKLNHLTDHAIEIGRERILIILLDMGFDNEAGDAAASELDEYLFIANNLVGNYDTYSWWRSKPFPHLKLVAPRLISLKPSSANTERLFSGLQWYAAPRRNRLGIDTLVDMTTISS